MEDLTIGHLVARLSEELKALAPLLEDAIEDQYHSSAPAPRKLGQSSPPIEHPKRPTEDIVTDVRRLVLRRSVQSTGEALKLALVLVISARRTLTRSHDRWKGLTPDESA